MGSKRLLVATDSPALFEQVKSALLDASTNLFWAKTGQDVMAFLADEEVDLVVCDLQIESMGGVAICYEMYLETSAGRIKKTPTILLLDRQADEFLAKKAGADDYMVKPLNALRLKQMADGLLFQESLTS